MSIIVSQALASAADIAIAAARADNTIIVGTSEPNQVARLVTSLPKLLVDAWRPYVRGGGLTVTGAFCHAKPRVTWQSPLLGMPHRSPELADLLLIFDRKDAAGNRTTRSLLVQAKRSDGGTCKLTENGDLSQRYMFAAWPPMSLLGVPAGFHPPAPLHLAPPAGDVQARYACVDDQPLAVPCWTLEDAPSTMPSAAGLASFKDVGPVPLSLKQSLGTGLMALYEGTLGRQCDVKGDHWSELMRYLEIYISCHVPNEPKVKNFPAVQVVPGVSPLPLVAATSFFKCFPIDFPRYAEVQHLMFGLDDWVDPHCLRPTADGGVLYDWPPFNTAPPQEPVNLDRPGIGLLRIAIDEPFLQDVPGA